MAKTIRCLVSVSIILLLAPISVSVAEASVGGPDQFGYRWVDSDQPWGPEYEWIDISEVGTRVTAIDLNRRRDAIFGPYSIGFDFPYYGNTFGQFWLTPNGYITFNAEEFSSSSNSHIIDTYTGRGFPRNFIAMLWTVLHPYTETLTNGDGTTTHYDRPVYYYHDVENDRFILSFYHVSYHSSQYHLNAGLPVSDVSFQLILYPDGRIQIQYGDMYDTDCDEIDWDVYDDHRVLCQFNNQTTVIGIGNAAGDDGLEVAFNEPYIHDNLAILFYPEPLFDYDTAPLSFSLPTERWQAGSLFAPTATFENLGSQAASFYVNLTISYDGNLIYSETGNINDLESLASTDFTFPNFTPADTGTYLLTASSVLNTDQNVLNDTMTIEFEVLPVYLPAVGFSATNSQNGSVPLSWYEPGTPPATLLSYDNNIPGIAFAWGGYLFANEFNCMAPTEVCSLFVRVISNNDIHAGPYLWPNMPDAIHDSLKVYVFGDDGSGMPYDTLADLTLTCQYNHGGWISYAFNPPLLVETDKFWVGYQNILDGYYDGFLVDQDIHYPEATWYVDEYGEWNHSVMWNGDLKIRASVLNGRLDVGNQGLDVVGYNIYRDTQPGVIPDTEHRIAEQLSGYSYDDSDVSNGTTYYYTATVIYSDGENTFESAPTTEVSATPAEGGQLIADHESLDIGPLMGGVIDTTQIVLTNNGDLDVSFSISTSIENNPGLARRAMHTRPMISPENSYFYIGT